jgi:hypothetical protein
VCARGTGEGGGDWGGGEGFLKEVGQLGLGVRQSGESERLGFGVKGSIWGGRSLRSLDWWGLGS